MAMLPNDHPTHSNMRELFRRFAAATSAASGSAWTFVTAVVFLIAWAVSYPLFLQFAEPLNTWQLIINTATTIVTFLMVFLIQNTQNRDAKALHLKLDELIRALRGARNRMVDLEECSDEELDQLKKEFHRIRNETDGTERETADQQLANLEMEEQNRRK